MPGFDKGSPSRVALQKTVAGGVHLEGVTLHAGQMTSLSIWPASENHGIRFLRRDVTGTRQERTIPARWNAVAGTCLATTLANEAGHRVSTVEHLLAATAALGIDNALVVVDGPEVPILDGSALPFIEGIQSVGIEVQAAPRRFLQVLRQVTVSEGDAHLTVEPAPAFSVQLEIDFGMRAIEHRRYGLRVTPESFEREIASARTFGFAHDIGRLREAGLCLGGTFACAVVLDGNGRVVNRDGLRMPGELVRHKILDCIGDLSLAGAPVLGRVSGRKSGHGLNCRLLAELFSQEDAWEWSTPVHAWPAVGGSPDIRPGGTQGSMQS